MKWVKLGKNIEQVRGVTYKKDEISDIPKKDFVPLLRADSIQESNLNYDNLLYVNKSKVKEEQYLRKGDILIAASSGSKKVVGKSALVKNTDESITFGAFCKVIRAKQINAKFLSYFFRTTYYRQTIENIVTGANINNLTTANIDELDIINLSKEEQKYVVDRLETIDNIISTRQAQIETMDELIQSLFYEMFGDSLLAPKIRSKIYKLEDLTFEILGGGTPTKSNTSYYNGEIQWITPKDMKKKYVDMSQITITNQGLENSSAKLIPPYSLLMVIRSGILKRYVPLAINLNEVTINQDMKAFVFKDNVNILFIYSYLKSIERALLNMVRGVTADNFDFDDIRNIPIPLPPIDLQNQFAEKVQAIEKQKAKMQKSLEEMQILFDALMQKAFSGGLRNI